MGPGQTPLVNQALFLIFWQDQLPLALLSASLSSCSISVSPPVSVTHVYLQHIFIGIFLLTPLEIKSILDITIVSFRRALNPKG
jgi:hypothetical protein